MAGDYSKKALCNAQMPEQVEHIRVHVNLSTRTCLLPHFWEYIQWPPNVRVVEVKLGDSTLFLHTSDGAPTAFYNLPPEALFLTDEIETYR